jgi:hypothetical protein
VIPLLAGIFVLVAVWLAQSVHAEGPGVVGNLKWAIVTALGFEMTRQQFLEIPPLAELPVTMIIGTSLSSGLIFALLLRDSIGLIPSVLAGIAAGMAAGLVAMLMPFLLSSRDHILTFRGLVRRSRMYAFWGGLACGSAGGLADYLSQQRSHGVDMTQVAAWAVGIGLITLRYSSWGSYMDALAVAAIERDLPLRFVRFLEDLATMGVVRENSAGCEFRHQRLARKLREMAADDGLVVGSEGES